MSADTSDFVAAAARIINSGQARTLLLTGQVSDIFRCSQGDEEEYLPLVGLLTRRWRVPGTILVVYELNGPIRFLDPTDARKVRDAWAKLHQEEDTQRAIDLALARTRKRIAELEQQDPGRGFDACLAKASANPTFALEFLRQLCLCSRLRQNDVPLLWEDLIVLIEGADFLIPEGEIGRMSEVDRQRVAICRDWFADPGFVNGGDTAVLVAESRSLLNAKVARLPQVLEVEIPSPTTEDRLRLIRWFNRRQSSERRLRLWSSQEALAAMTAGLSSHALLQLLRSAVHAGTVLRPEGVVAKVEHFIQDQLGEDVVEFKKPEHTLRDVVGFHELKAFLRRELMPRIRATGRSALPGAVVGGPIGVGKSFLLEAVAGELGIVVLVLKNIRSKWFGETDMLFERLRRILCALDKSLVFVDEADTQFGGLGEEVHETERRLTGKVQAMMSDPLLRGRTCWLLITARIHRLSPDIRRPGRAGSLVIPLLDPEGEDFEAFVRWMIAPVFGRSDACPELGAAVRALAPEVEGYYAAAFAEVRSGLVAAAEIAGKTSLDVEDIRAILADHIPPAVEKTRRYQTLQALVNCTRRSLLPGKPAGEELKRRREEWLRELRRLEAEGIG
ncbi:MAG: ATP-binding protein [Lentisphaeria bacterium]|nr:ATP-binding protein [Lentisphaeria bacterium]